MVREIELIILVRYIYIYYIDFVDMVRKENDKILWDERGVSSLCYSVGIVI